MNEVNFTSICETLVQVKNKISLDLHSVVYGYRENESFESEVSIFVEW